MAPRKLNLKKLLKHPGKRVTLKKNKNDNFEGKNENGLMCEETPGIIIFDILN